MRYVFDNLGRRQKVTSYSDDNCTTAVNEVAFDYNGLGALSAEHQEHDGAVAGGTLAVEYAYDTTSGRYNGLSDVLTKGLRLTDMTYPNGRKSFRSYGSSGGLADKLSRLAAIKDDNGSGSEGDTLASYNYNGVGTLVVEDFEQPDVRLDYFGGTTGTYAGFDRFGRVQQQLWRDYGASEDREKFAYDHDYNSNRKYRENVVAGAASKKLDELYAYDDLDRLVDFKRGKLDANKTDIPTTDNDRLRREEWTLSDTGNWSAYKVDANGDGDYSDAGDLDQSRTHNAVNELTAISESGGQSAWADPVHDARGNMTTVPKPADMTGTYTCTYDAWNRLVKVSDGATVVAEYRYDGLGRRCRKYVPDGGDWTVTEYYYSAAWQVLEVRRDDGKARSGDPLSEPTLATTLREQYVWSPRYIDSPVLRDRDAAAGGDLGKTDSGLDERLYYLTDAQMNVTTLVDTGGDAVERYTYDPYGKVAIYDGTWTNTRSSSSYANEVLYCGYRLDVETGLYQVRNRVYHPLLGRWVQRDPLDLAVGPNLYEYVESTPVCLTDPWGLEPPGGAAGWGNRVVPLGGGHTGVIEWSAQQGIGEMKVLGPKGAELARFRYDRAAGTVKEILEHGGKKLPGISNRAGKKILAKLPGAIKKMVELAGGRFAPVAARTAVQAGPASAGTLARIFKGIGTLAISIIGILDMTATECQAPTIVDTGDRTFEVDLREFGLTEDDFAEAATQPAVTPDRQPRTERPKQYVIQPGDNLWRVMLKYGWDPRDRSQMDTWLNLNPKTKNDPKHWLYVGDNLNVPKKQ